MISKNGASASIGTFTLPARALLLPGSYRARGLFPAIQAIAGPDQAISVITERTFPLRSGASIQARTLSPSLHGNL